MARYIHKMTGSIDDEIGWVAAYDQEELAARDMTAEAAFRADIGVTLFELASHESAASALGRKGGSVKSDAKKRSSAENGKLGGRPKKQTT